MMEDGYRENDCNQCWNEGYDEGKKHRNLLKWVIRIMIPTAIFCFVGFTAVMWAMEATTYLDQCRIELKELEKL